MAGNRRKRSLADVSERLRGVETRVLAAPQRKISIPRQDFRVRHRLAVDDLLDWPPLEQPLDRKFLLLAR
jgi:hypothetical protein